MTHTVNDFKTLKELKNAIRDKVTVRCYNSEQPNLWNYSGPVTIDGPHFPKSHKWKAEGHMVDGILVSVK